MPLIRYGVKDALEHFREGGKVRVMKNGTGEILQGEREESLGYLTKRSLELFLKAVDEVNRPNEC